MIFTAEGFHVAVTKLWPQFPDFSLHGCTPLGNMGVASKLRTHPQAYN
jgi:hypothetical protein